MKILLASDSGFLNDTGYDLLRIPFSKMNVGYVFTPSKKIDEPGHVDLRLSEMEAKGMRVEAVDIEGKKLKELREMFADKNIIYVKGGDTFYLMRAALQSDFQIYLKEFFERGGIYIGVSAGAYIMGPSIETALWKNPSKDTCGLTDLAGLNFVPFMFFAHYKPEMEENVKAKALASSFPVRVMKDGQGIFMADGKYIFAGTGEETVF